MSQNKQNFQKEESLDDLLDGMEDDSDHSGQDNASYYSALSDSEELSSIATEYPSPKGKIFQPKGANEVIKLFKEDEDKEEEDIERKAESDSSFVLDVYIAHNHFLI